MDRHRLLDVINLEKKRLDNRSIMGGFDRFVCAWGHEMGIRGWSETEQRLREYETLPPAERSLVVTFLEQTIRGLSEPDMPLPGSPKPEQRPGSDEVLHQPVRYLKGVGPVLERKLSQLGIHTIQDMVYYFPRTYRDRGAIVSLSEIRAGRFVTVEAIVSGHKRVPTRRKPLLKIVLAEGEQIINLVCFNQDYLARLLIPGKRVRITGSFTFRYGAWETSDFDFELIDHSGPKRDFTRIVPVYPLTEGLSQKKLTAMIAEAIESFLGTVEDVLPDSVREHYRLLPKYAAIRELHQPNRSSIEDLVNRKSQAHRSIIFEEFLVFALGLKLRRRALKKARARSYHPDLSTLVTRFREGLPFRLTDAQERVFREIVTDLARPIPMSRLVQGDVGSGKTLVALLASLQVIAEQSQAALMVPTEILAEQHYGRWKETLEKLGVKVGLLRGGTGKEKRALVKHIAEKNIDLVIGTHALIQESVTFADLGLVIVDEQHRFGVAQRSKLQAKANLPHVLVMTATPIPRTLALTLYGDLDISVVDHKPAGRKKVETLSFSDLERHKAYNRVAHFLGRGHQAFVVCPAIEENDEEIVSVERIFEDLRTKWLKESRIAVIHGRLPSREKETTMHRFIDRELDVLVATSVIEVGVDIPTANVMVIENAERFGLAQLHQLRGRIGRGTSEGLCILLTRSQKGPAVERTKIMTATDDGFVIAEEDLKMRGPGEFFGFRQHGLAEFRLAEPFADWVILEQAVAQAETTLACDPGLSLPGNAAVCRAIQEHLARCASQGDRA